MLFEHVDYLTCNIVYLYFIFRAKRLLQKTSDTKNMHLEPYKMNTLRSTCGIKHVERNLKPCTRRAPCMIIYVRGNINVQ